MQGQPAAENIRAPNQGAATDLGCLPVSPGGAVDRRFQEIACNGKCNGKWVRIFRLQGTARGRQGRRAGLLG